MHPRIIQTGRYFRSLARSFPGSLFDFLLVSAKSVNFSNFGEDLLLMRMFRLPKDGFYVDVGANHPIVASNTFRLDLLGWSGIAIEPNPDLAGLFPKLRPSCKIIANAVGESDQILEYIKFNVDQCNTFDPVVAADARKRGTKEIGRIKIATTPLNDILAEHAGNRLIDVMSIDIEGLEMPVFRSHDWKRWSPAIILAEDHLPIGQSIENSELATFLSSKGYYMCARVHFTTFFVHRDHAERLAW